MTKKQCKQEHKAEKLAASSTESDQPRCTWRILWPVLCLILFMDIYLRLHLYLTDNAKDINEITWQSRLEQCRLEQSRLEQSRFQQRLHDLLLSNSSAMANCPQFFLKINKLLSQFYPRESVSLDTLLRTKSDSEADTCGEEYKGSTYGLPFFHTGFVESSKCNRAEKLPISRLVTIVLLVRVLDKNQTVRLLESIRDYNRDIPIVLGTMALDDRTVLERKFNNLKIMEYKERAIMDQPGRVFNFMIREVKTPYTLVARDIFYFTNFTRLERQIYVISSTSIVGVAGGAFQNETGFWKVGCYQSRLRNYVLKYTQGYTYSVLDCMLCDYLEGPFVVKTSIATKILFSANMFTQVLFHDWFLALKQANILVMNCPDALYYKSGLIEGVPEVDRKREHISWLGLAKQWHVDRTEFPPRGSFDFTCKQLKHWCNHSGGRFSLIRSCCMLELTGALKTVDDFAQQYNLDYEIESGTLLGAVKLGNVLPWDLDGDISFMKKDLHVFQKNAKYFKKREYFVNSFIERYFKLLARKFLFDMEGRNSLSNSQYPYVMYNISTRIKINGLWMKSMWNPGLVVRNRYGPDVYKHAPHWKVTKKRDSWERYTPGVWLQCRRGLKHGCLDRYPTDGSEELLPDHLIKKNLAFFPEDVRDYLVSK